MLLGLSSAIGFPVSDSDSAVPEVVGMISGNGIYPATFARAARAAGVGKLVVAAFKGETEPSLEDDVDEIEWFRVGQLSKMIKFFARHGVKQAVMVGQIAPKNLFDLRPDFRVLFMMAKMKKRNAESLFGGIANELQKDDITLLPATTFLEDNLPGPGHIAGPSPKKRQLDDVAYGFQIAKETSRLDIGQSVVVKKGTVLAVEAFEGTDRAVKRGGEMGRGGAMLVKVSKPNQDLRFDVPVVGPATIQNAADSGVNAVVVEAGMTLLLDKKKVFQLCNDLGVMLYATSGEKMSVPQD